MVVRQRLPGSAECGDLLGRLGWWYLWARVDQMSGMIRSRKDTKHTSSYGNIDSSSVSLDTADAGGGASTLQVDRPCGGALRVTPGGAVRAALRAAATRQRGGAPGLSRASRRLSEPSSPRFQGAAVPSCALANVGSPDGATSQ